MGSPARRSPWRAFAAVAVVLVVLAGAAAGAVVYLLSPVDPNGVMTEFEVLPGWGASRIARELEGQGLIRSPEAFVAYVRFRELDRSVGEGLYDLSPAMDARELARRLQAGGRPRVVRVVIPEGFRANEIAARLAAAGLGDEDRFRELIARPGELASRHAPEGATLEGYLFPASYDVPVRSSPEAVLRSMVQRFEREVDDGVVAELEDLGLSVHEWVVLGSIVQSEAGGSAEMPTIAGVFLNRLDIGMMLQSDPTVAYGLGIRLNQLNRFEGHFTMASDHPWNTYTRGGIPPGAIGSPGREALRAVLSAERLAPGGQPWLYFLHSRDGSVFRPNLTLADHERDVQRYLR